MPADASRLRGALSRWVTRVLAAAREETVRNTRRDPQVPRGERPRPGARRLRESIEAHGPVHSSGSRATARMRAPVIQAATTDKGARPHVIRPRRPGGVLVFPKDGRIIFARRVNHPGNAPMRWWRPVLTRAYGQGLRTAARRTPFT